MQICNALCCSLPLSSRVQTFVYSSGNNSTHQFFFFLAPVLPMFPPGRMGGGGRWLLCCFWRCRPETSGCCCVRSAGIVSVRKVVQTGGFNEIGTDSVDYMCLGMDLRAQQSQSPEPPTCFDRPISTNEAWVVDLCAIQYLQQKESLQGLGVNSVGEGREGKKQQRHLHPLFLHF